MTSTKPSHVIKAGRKLGGRYTLINRIATGGMGEVWRARDTLTGALVAAKVLRPELTGEEISLSRLRLEAKNAMKANHPNIAAVLDSGENDGQGWIIMELVVGKPLVDFVGDGNSLAAEELIPILIQVAYALDGSAQAGIVHRDIKPANIMIREDGLVKLTDFGISYSQGQATLTAVGMVMGTAQYLAPEQAVGGEATLAGDLYSLGIIAYEALAGFRPFTGKTIVDIAMAHVNEPVPALPDEVPSHLANVVYALLEKDPENRYRSGIALVRALNGAADAMGVSPEPRPIAPAVSKAEAPLGADKLEGAGTSQRSASQKPPVPRRPTREQAAAGQAARPPAIPPSPSQTSKQPASKLPPSKHPTFGRTASRTPGPRRATAQRLEAQRASSARTYSPPPRRTTGPTDFVDPDHLPKGSSPSPTGSWKPLSSTKAGGRPARKVGPKRKPSGSQRPSTSQGTSGAQPLWKKPGFWVLLVIALALLLFVINSYFSAKSTIASQSESFPPQLLYKQEVKAWSTLTHSF